MNKGFAAAVTPAKTTYLVNANDIEVDHSTNNRFKPGKIEGLMQSIQEQGQLQAVSVIKTKPEGKLKLTWGFGRVEAIKRLNEGKPEDQQIKVRVEIFNGNEDEAFFANADENMIRNDLTPIDKAIVFRKMTDRFGMKQADIAKRYKKTPAWVSQHLSLLTLDTKIQNKVHSGDIPFSEAVSMATMKAEDRETVIAKTESAQAAVATAAPEVQKKAARKAAVAAVKEVKQASKPVKRNLTDIRDFFEISYGSPAVSKKMSALAGFMVNLIDGIPDQDDEAVELLEKILKEK